MGGRSDANSTAPGVAGYQVMSSSQATPIPIVYGTNRITGNMIWYGDFTTTNTGQAGKGGTGGSQAGYTYTASAIIAACEGPIQGFGQIWAGSILTALPYLGLSPFLGTVGQATWSYMTTLHPTQALPYSNTAYAAGVYQLGNSSALPNIGMEIAGIFANQISVAPTSGQTTGLLIPMQGSSGSQTIPEVITGTNLSVYAPTGNAPASGELQGTLPLPPLTGAISYLYQNYFGGSRNVNFIGNSATTAVAAALINGSNPWTIDFWWNSSIPSGTLSYFGTIVFYNLVTGGSGALNFITISPGQSSSQYGMQLTFWATNGSNYSVNTGPISGGNNTWRWTVIQFDGTTLSMYISGTKVYSATMASITGGAYTLRPTDSSANVPGFLCNTSAMRLAYFRLLPGAQYSGSTIAVPTLPPGTVSLAPTPGIDSLAGDVVSLLHMGNFGGINGFNNNGQTFTDAISTTTWAVAGSGIFQSSSGQILGLATTCLFEGGSNNKLVSNLDTAAELLTSDFCIELWFDCFMPGTEPINLGLFAKRAYNTQFNEGYWCYIFGTSSPTIYFEVVVGGVQYGMSAPLTSGYSSWNSLAITRAGTAWTMWLNGTAVAGMTLSGSVNTSAGEYFVLGDYSYIPQLYQFSTFYGYMAEFRFTLGNSRYTGTYPSGTYVPQSTPFTLTVLVGTGEADVNPWAIVQDLLTNAIYGCAFPAAYLDPMNNFYLCCEASYYKCSPMIDSQRAAHEILKEIIDIGVAEAIWSGGLLKVIPYADGNASRTAGYDATVLYTAPSSSYTPQYVITDDQFLDQEHDDPVKVTRIAAVDAKNILTAGCVNRSNAYQPYGVQVIDQAHFDNYGARPMPNLDIPMVTIPQIASDIARLALNRAQYQRNTYEFTLGWAYCLLEPMDLIEINDAAIGLSNAVVRIKKIEEDEEGNLKFTCEDYIPNLYNSPTYGATASPASVVTQAINTGANSGSSPSNTNAPMLWQPPYSMTPGGNTPQLWVGISGGSNWGGAAMYISVDGGDTYSFFTNITTSIQQGVLTAAFPVGSDPDTTDTLSVNLTECSGSLTSVVDGSADLQTTLTLVDGELICFSTATLTTQYNYNCTTYTRRGQNGTGIAPHAIGGTFNYLGTTQNVYKMNISTSYAGLTLYFKFASVNAQGGSQQPLQTLPAYTATVYIPYFTTTPPTTIATGYTFDVPQGASYSVTGPLVVQGLLTVEGTLAVS